MNKFVLSLLSISLLFSCSATRKETKIHPSETFEETQVQYSNYRSPQDRNGQDERVRFAIAISGGGHRAANLGVGALIGLEKIETPQIKGDNALSQVDMISSVSGGGFAAGIYISTLNDYFRYCGENKPYSLMEVIDVDSKKYKGCFDPIARRQLERGYKDNIFSFLNPFQSSSWKVWFTDLDRTNLLEKAIDDDLLGSKWRRENKKDQLKDSLKMKDIFIPRSETTTEVRLPLWITNATIFENGAIFPFSPDILMAYEITNYTHQLQPVPPQSKEEWSQEEYKQFIFNMPMALAVAASGNFPVALPATTLKSKLDPDNPYLHLLDGGLSDNLGVFSALRYLSQENKTDLIEKKLLIVIDAYNGPLGPTSKNSGAPLWSDALKKTTSASLDSWRGRYREIIYQLAEAKNIEVVFISPDSFNKAEDFDKLYALEYRLDGNIRLTEGDIKKLKDKWNTKHNTGEQTDITAISPMDLFYNVSTDYNVSPENQKFLIALGWGLVKEKSELIQGIFIP